MQTSQFFLDKAKAYIKDFESYKVNKTIPANTLANDTRLKVKLMISEFDNSKYFLAAFEQVDASKPYEKLDAKVDRYSTIKHLY
jgi:hypothetical protein